LSSDDVWITREGHAKLLYFHLVHSHASPVATGPASAESAQRFLSQVAACALAGGARDDNAGLHGPPYHALPLSASAALTALERGGGAWSEIVPRLVRLTT